MRQNSVRNPRLFRALRFGILAILVFVFTCVEAQRSEHHYLVRGRIVDREGEPVPGAIVYLDPVPSADQIFGTTADAKGTFQLEETTPTRRKLRRLYVTAPPPQGAMLIRPPYNLLPRLTGREFAGKQLILGEPQTNVGDVEVQIYYGLVEVRLNDCDNKSLFVKPEQWKYVYFRLRNRFNETIKETTLSQDDIVKAFDSSKSTIEVALPVGVWNLEISTSGFDGPWLRSSTPVDVKLGTQQWLALQSCRNK